MLLVRMAMIGFFSLTAISLFLFSPLKLSMPLWTFSHQLISTKK